MKGRAISILLMAGLVIMLGVGVSAASAERQQTATLKAIFYNTQQVAFDVLVKNFNNVYPNIKVEVQYLPLGQFPAVVNTQFQAGNPPDVFNAAAGNLDPSSIYPLAAQGRLLDLSSSPWKKRILPTMRQYVSRRGKIHGWPISYISTNLFFNRPLLRSIGATVPTTFPEMLAFCARAKAAGKIPIAVGLAEFNGQGHLSTLALNAFLYSKDPDFTVKRIQRKVTWAGSARARRSLEALVQMKDAGCFSSGVAGTTVSGAQRQLATEQAVMVSATIANRGSLLALNPNLELGAIVLPGESASDRVAGLNAVVVAASATTRYPTQARLFIDFLGRAKQADLYSKIVGGLGGYELSKGQLPDYYRDLAPAYKKTVMFQPIAWPRADLWVSFVSQIPGLFTGQRTVPEILTNLDTNWDRR